MHTKSEQFCMLAVEDLKGVTGGAQRRDSRGRFVKESDSQRLGDALLREPPPEGPSRATRELNQRLGDSLLREPLPEGPGWAALEYNQRLGDALLRQPW